MTGWHVTSQRHATFSARTLPSALLFTSRLGLASATFARELPIPRRATGRPAYHLCLARRRRWNKRLPALAASMAHHKTVAPVARIWPAMATSTARESAHWGAGAQPQVKRSPELRVLHATTQVAAPAARVTSHASQAAPSSITETRSRPGLACADHAGRVGHFSRAHPGHFSRAVKF
jgi:hypothetical protein